jgi:hypothetical protein
MAMVTDEMEGEGGEVVQDFLIESAAQRSATLPLQLQRRTG